MTAQHIINNIEFARKFHQIHDTIIDSHLLNLKEMLAVEGNLIDWRLTGGVTVAGKPSLQLQVTGLLTLTCQRCLESMPVSLDIDTTFVLVPDELSVPSDEDNSDDQEYLVADDKMSVIDLLQDEILLALPLAPKHDAVDCLAKGKAYESKKVNPFEALKALKVNKS